MLNISNTHKAFVAIGAVVAGLTYTTKRAFAPQGTDKTAGVAQQNWIRSGIDMFNRSTTKQKLAVGAAVVATAAFSQLSATHKAFVALAAVVSGLGYATKVAVEMDAAGWTPETDKQ